MTIVSIEDTNSSMQLSSYLSDHDISIPQFAQKIGAANRTIVWRYVHGIRRPNKKMLQRIYDVTNGEVTPNDFFDLDS